MSVGARLARAPGVFYILVLLVLAFGVAEPSFLGAANLGNIGLQSAILLMLALPMTLIIMTEGLDLSMGAVLSLCGIVLALALLKGYGLPVALAAALAVGLAFGVANGALVAWLDLPPFVVTLGTMGVAQGLALVVSDAQSVVGFGDAVSKLYGAQVLGVPFPVLVAAAAYALMHFLLYHTRFGAYVFALGGNREALVLAGARANVYLVAVYALGGAMVGLAALLLTGRMNAGHPTAAIGMEFDAIAAVIVGGTSFERGNGWLFGTVLGVLAVGVLKNGLNLLAVQSALQVAAIGVLVIVALLVDSLRGRS
jgi:ribose transport system permease protein